MKLNPETWLDDFLAVSNLLLGEPEVEKRGEENSQ